MTRNFAGVETGRDMGGLWENYMVSERLKYARSNRLYMNTYYWRKRTGAEVDYVEEYDGEYHPYEFKFGKDVAMKNARDFRELYDVRNEIQVINRDNFLDLFPRKW